MKLNSTIFCLCAGLCSSVVLNQSFAKSGDSLPLSSNTNAQNQAPMHVGIEPAFNPIPVFNPAPMPIGGQNTAQGSDPIPVFNPIPVVNPAPMLINEQMRVPAVVISVQDQQRNEIQHEPVRGQLLYREEDEDIDPSICTRAMARILVGGYSAYGGGHLVVSPYTRIENGAFAYTEGFSEVLLRNVVSIGIGAFDHCQNLREISDWGNVKTIDDGAFSNTGLTEIVLPHGIRRIGDMAFSYCANLVRVRIPNTITSIGKDVFKGCNRECEFIVSSKYMKKMLKKSEALPKGSNIVVSPSTYLMRQIQPLCPDNKGTLILPSNINKIDDYMFMNREDIKSIILPDGVTSIGKMAFFANVVFDYNSWRFGERAKRECLKDITIPSSVQSIEEDAFKPKSVSVKFGRTICSRDFWATVNVMFNGDEILDSEKDRIGGLLRGSGFEGIINFIDRNMRIIDSRNGVATYEICSDIDKFGGHFNARVYKTIDVDCGENVTELDDEVRSRVTRLLRDEGFVGTIRFFSRDVISRENHGSSIQTTLNRRYILTINDFNPANVNGHRL